jgi:hypothetical protein
MRRPRMRFTVRRMMVEVLAARGAPSPPSGSPSGGGAGCGSPASTGGRRSGTARRSGRRPGPIGGGPPRRPPVHGDRFLQARRSSPAGGRVGPHQRLALNRARPGLRGHQFLREHRSLSPPPPFRSWRAVAGRTGPDYGTASARERRSYVRNRYLSIKVNPWRLGMVGWRVLGLIDEEPPGSSPGRAKAGQGLIRPAATRAA